VLQIFSGADTEQKPYSDSNIETKPENLYDDLEEKQ